MLSKPLGRFNRIDVFLVSMVIIGVLGVFLVQAGFHVTSGQEVLGEKDILITVAIPSLKTMDANLFQPGEQTSITIRNQPRGAVTITKAVKHTPQAVFILPSGKPVTVPDLSQEHSIDYVVTLKDHAKVSKEGYVTEGVKVKIGLPIELEGYKYRVYGKIIDVNPI
jgi:hypothetical protein